MSLNRQEKAAMIQEISELVADAGSVVIAEYRGLTVDAATRLRKNAREKDVKLRVLKNTLVNRAIKDTPFAVLSDKLAGPLMYGFSTDPVAAAKVLSDFAKTDKNLVIKAGSMPNHLLGVEEINQLAALPSREELLAQLMATMNAPITQFVRTLNEVPSRFVRTLAAVRDAKESAPAA
ncbi:MAG: 50S ribosomal protein L10 [Burkholderiales bacterium]|nr:50S ribosomal protein L10 [Burkholderiales bacterium]